MTALLDAPGTSLRGASRRRRAAGATHPTVAAHLIGDPVGAPVGRLVASRYRLRSLLGRGGMGRVWLAEDELLRRPVALKQVLLERLESPADIRAAARVRALREARTAASVDHLGAVRIHDVVEDDRCPWIVMERLSGRTLEEALRAAGPLPVDEVASIGLCVLDVLQAAHRAGIVHRDVKPSNVHLCDGGRVVLTDFGVACTVDDAVLPTVVFAGSPAYVSPEALGGGEFGPASDLFSLGATLFAAVEGRPPFDRGSLFATLAAVAEEPPAPFLRAGPLRPVIEGLLVKDPDTRLGVDQARAALLDVRRCCVTSVGKHQDVHGRAGTRRLTQP